MKKDISRRNMMKFAGAASMFSVLGSVNAQQNSSRKPMSAMAMSGAFMGAYKDGQYMLPDLPYALDALEPFYEKETLEIHYSKHHAGYVKGLNATLSKLAQARKGGDWSSIKALSRDLAFNGSGHVLHCLFWHSMTPNGAEVPDTLGQKLIMDFGSVKAGMEQFAAATKAVEGSGWGILAYEPIGNQLVVLQAEKHQNLTIWGVEPLLVCDVWEHAYYLQYQNNRGSFVDNFMKIANWHLAEARLQAAMGH